MRQIIPLATSAVTLWAMWVIGQKRSWGWTLGLANQALWLWFIIGFQAWGLLPLSGALVVIYTRNLFKWRADERTVIA